VHFCAFWGFSGAGILKKRTHLSFRINRPAFRMDRLDSSEAWRVAVGWCDWVHVDEGADVI
jgi:hypothetical protein